MGVTFKESIKTGYIEVIGLILGLLSMLLIYPLSDKAFGFIQFLYSSGLILIPIINFGISNTIIKYFPSIDKEKKSEFYFFSVFLSLVQASLLLIIILLFSSSILNFVAFIKMDVDLIRSNFLSIYSISILLSLINNTTSYLSSFNLISLTSMIREISFKICVPVLVLLFYFNFITLPQIPKILIFYFLIMLLVLIAYALQQRILKISLKFNLKYFISQKNMFNYMFFVSLMGLGSILAFKVDMVMISSLVDLEANGVYAKILIIAGILDIPARVLTKTVSPVISDHWYKNNLIKIGELYQTTSLNMFIAGTFLFIILWFLMPDIISYSSNPSSFRNFSEIFLILGFGKLIDLLAGLNNTIIGYSAYYKANLYFLLLLAIVNVILNYVFINKYGIVGAAMATLIALIIFNISKGLYIYYKFKMHPFTSGIIKTVIIGIIGFFALFALPNVSIPLLNIVLKGLVFCIVFIIPLIYYKVSPEINEYYRRLTLLIT